MLIIIKPTDSLPTTFPNPVGQSGTAGQITYLDPNYEYTEQARTEAEYNARQVAHLHNWAFAKIIGSERSLRR